MKKISLVLLVALGFTACKQPPIPAPTTIISPIRTYISRAIP